MGYDQKPNAVLERTFELALEGIRISKVLNEQHEYVLSRQLLKSSTSPGAMAEEAQGAHSLKDFVAKFEIGHKELRKSSYWLRLIVDYKILDEKESERFKSLNKKCLRLFTTIIKSSKEKLDANG